MTKMNHPIMQSYSNRGYRYDAEQSDQSHSEPIGRVDPRRYLDMIFANLWIILGITIVITMGGVAYAFLAEPVYKATILVQVEDTGGLPPAVSPTDALKPFDIKASTAPELEVLRSRMVVAHAVDNTKSYIEVEPKYFPVVGAWSARRAKAVSNPGIMGHGGYIWGTEQAAVSLFNVPAELEGLPFVLTVGEAGSFSISQKDYAIQFSGHVGNGTSYQAGNGIIELQVDRLLGKPGAQFTIRRMPRLSAIEALQRDLLIIEKGKQSGVIAVSLEGANPEKITAMLKEISHGYLRQNEARRSEGAEKMLAFIEGKLPSLKQAMEQSEKNFNEARNRHGVNDLGEEAKALMQLSVWSQTKQLELNQKKTELMARYTDVHPMVMEVESQIKALNLEMNQIGGRIKKLPEVEQEIVRLNREVKVNTEVYTNVVNTAQQLRLASASKVGNVRLLDAPEMPVQPTGPKTKIVISAAATIGLLLGLLAAMIKKSFFGRIYSPEDIEQKLGLQVGGVILHSRAEKHLSSPSRISANPTPLLPCREPSDIAVEGLRRMWSILPPGLRKTCSDITGADASFHNVMAIIGPTPDVGKSFVSANFAAVLASSGKKVLLIDGDLRTGRLHRNFGLPCGSGFSDALAGEMPIDHVVRKNVIENLDFISTGHLPAGPAELLAHPNLAAILKTLSSRYNVIIIDTAPILPVSDTLFVLPHVDMIFNIVRAGVTTLNEIEEMVKQLNRTGVKVTTTIFNDMKSRQIRYGYSEGYC